LSWDITAINFMQNVIQYFPFKVKSVHRWSYRVSSVRVSMQQIWSDFLCSSDTGEKTGVQWDSISAIHRLQESLWFSQEGSFVPYSHWVRFIWIWLKCIWMKCIVKWVRLNICLMIFISKMIETKRYSITTAFQLCFRIYY
jgi:hypothetical protein